MQDANLLIPLSIVTVTIWLAILVTGSSNHLVAQQSLDPEQPVAVEITLSGFDE